MFLNADTSQFTYRGPTSALRPSLPNCSTEEFGAWLILWKAFTLNHSAAVRGPEFGVHTPLGRLLENPEISGACPCSETSLESNTVNGVPLMAVKIPFNCQLPRTLPYKFVEFCKKGRLHGELSTTRWRASNMEGPRSAARLNGSCARSFSPATGCEADPVILNEETSSMECDQVYDARNDRPWLKRLRRLASKAL